MGFFKSKQRSLPSTALGSLSNYINSNTDKDTQEGKDTEIKDKRLETNQLIPSIRLLISAIPLTTIMVKSPTMVLMKTMIPKLTDAKMLKNNK